MKKNLILGALIALSLMLATPSLLVAQSPPAKERAKMVEAFEKEPPLTQEDIDAFIRIMPELPKVARDKAKAAELIKKNGLSETRGSYVLGKIGLSSMALFSSQGEEATQTMLAKIPDEIKANDEEIALIKKNRSAIQKIYLESRRVAPKK